MQETVPPEELGRVTSLIFTLCYIANPIGIAVASFTGDVIGVNNLFIVLGVLLVINGLICYFRVRKSEMSYVKNRCSVIDENEL